MKQKNTSHATFLKSVENNTLPQILFKQAERLRERQVAVREKAYGIWETYSWSEYYLLVKQTALGFRSLGLKRGDSVGLILNNDPEWLFSELGAQSLGAVTLNMFTSAVTGELLHGITQLQNSFIVVQDQEQVDKLLECREKLPFVKKVIYVDPTGMRVYQNNPWLIGFRELLEMGKHLDAEQPELYARELWKGNPQDVALMIMTSGTTGKPKMVMLSHLNFIDISQKWLTDTTVQTGDNWISISPPAWIVDQMWGVGVTLMGGITMNFPETAETVTEDFREIGPTVIITSSKFWEDLASKIRVKISDTGSVKRWFYNISQKIGLSVVAREAKKEKIPWYLLILKWIATQTVSKPLLDRIGCLGFKAAYTGGHPISPDVIRFFRANGLNLKQCYGMTETCGIFQIQPDNEVKPETVGKSLPGTEIKINDDQEVMVKSRSNFLGYYQNPDATSEASRDGWFLTGDAGYVDDDGHLVILGRRQDITRTRTGQVFSPDFIETRLKFSPYIKEAVIWGEDREYVSAFINIDFENVGSWAEEKKIPYTTYTDLSQQPDIEKLICEEVMEVNRSLREGMKLRKILLLYKLLDADDEELTRTGKVRRKIVAGLYNDLIEAFYSDKKELDVSGQVHYRDGTVGIIETTVKILTIF